jgi:PAS domain S-box-containing protein
MAKIRVLVADDDLALREALADTIAATPDIEVAGQSSDVDGTVRAAEELRPDVVLLDVRMPGGGGAKAASEIHARVPSAKLVVLSAYEDQGTVIEMLEAGAIAYLVKGSPELELVDAIRRAARGQRSMPGDLGATLMADLLREVRERRQTEGKLRQSQERFEAMLRAAPDAMVIVDSSGVIELVNTQTESLFGYAAQELLGQNVDVLLPERFRGGHLAHRASYMSDPKVRPMGAGLQLFGRRKDGTEFPVDISLSPLRTEDGIKAVAAVRDITERRQAEELQRKSEQRLSLLLDSAPDAMVVVDPDGLIQMVNLQTERLFGYRREDLLGRNVDELLPKRFAGNHHRHRARYLQQAKTRPMGAGLELFARRKDGTEFPVDISLSPLETDSGRLVVAAVRDVSERKHAETELARSLELAERQRLFAHLVRVQEEERLKIASDIHDDTIQAMTAAGLRLQQLRRHIHEERDVDLLTKLEEAVHESIVRLRRLMFDLRPPALDRAGLGPALRDLLDRLHEDTGLVYVLRNELTGGELQREVRTSLYRIAQEALANVRKHAHAKRVEVDIRLLEGGCLVRITDDGVGFPADDALERPGHLGMVAMRERARVAGGWWKAQPAEGGGTMVEFWVPLDAGPDPLLPARLGAES